MSEQPRPERMRLLPWAIPMWLVDAVLVSIPVLGLVGRNLLDDGSDSAVEIVAATLAVVVILGRRRHPVAGLVLAVAATPIVVGLADRPSVIMLAALIALFHVATTHRARTAVIAGMATTVVFASVVIALLEEGAIEGGGLAAIAWPAFAAAAGAAVRAIRENLAGAQDRARRAEATRELEAERRVIEERLRIARDVHDLVAHHIAVINVQSGVAAHVHRNDAEAADTALANVRQAASTAIDELGQLLAVLRSPGEGAGPVVPAPDLDAIDDLISSFASSGLDVERRTSGARRPMSASAQVAAYRVAQEALTNAHKHGAGAATITQRFDDDVFEIVVSNRLGSTGRRDDRATGDNRGGYGLAGMRERVEAVGGALSLDTTDDRFTVRVTIPVGSAP